MATLFEASGEVGGDLARVDWLATPLGPPEQWPQSLRTVLHVLLSSRFSMWMAWGPDLTFFANEKYRRDTLGAKYPWALGRPAREVWSEIWADIGPRIRTVMTTGVASWDESLLLILERSGYPEETYHTFSYSPLADDDGQIVGMLCVVSEETERVIGDRRMTVLRDLGAALPGAREEDDVCAVAMGVLGQDLGVLPFSLVYLFGGEKREARLAGAAGVVPGAPVAPPVVGSGGAWPLGRARGGATVLVEDLAGRFGEVPCGAWEVPPSTAVAVPLAGSADREAYGVFIAGLNPHRPLDAGYRGFIDLVASRLSASISNARAYEAERRRAEKLTELDRAKTAFFTNVSHEFRTPLTLLLGPTSDALNDSSHPLQAVQRQRLELIHHSAERLLRLVNNLLDFSRLEEGSAEAHFEVVDLAAETAGLAELFRPVVERAGLSFDVECEPIESVVDREMWVKIVSNLLSNALKFTFDGGITLRLAPAEGGRQVELAVSDTGVGVDPSEQAHLFERFHRVSGARSRTYEGSGIGLALVAELAAILGGQAGAESVQGSGSTFTVRLPVGRRGAAARGDEADRASSEQVAAGYLEEAMRWSSEESPEPLEGSRPPQPPGRPRVLVVDDNADMRRYVAGLLGERYDVAVAVDGAEALERVAAGPFDLVLTDVMMPRLDGFGLLRALRAGASTSRLPVVMLSARAGEASAVEGLEAGADDYIVKPFSALELTARVRSILGLESARREAATREHAIAMELQRSLVPARDLTSGSLEIATYYQPGVRGTEVGGDWYDVVDLDFARSALVIGDVMGRGVRAAAVMGQLRASVRAYARTGMAPAEVLEAMDATVRELEGGQIVTCFFALYDPTDHQLEYANAGHLPPLAALPGGRLLRLDADLAPPLGSGPMTIHTARVRLEPGAVLLLYTDGLVERRGANLDDRIDLAGELLSSGEGPLSDRRSQLVETLASDDVDDDVALLMARVPEQAAPVDTVTSRLPSDGRAAGLARRLVAEALGRWDITGPPVGDVVLLASELATNAVLHGRDPIELRLSRREGGLLLEVFDAAGSLPRRRQPTAADETGRGLQMVRLLSAETGVRLVADGKWVWCTVPVDA